MRRWCLAWVVLCAALWGCDTPDCAVEGCPGDLTCDRASGLCEEVVTGGCTRTGCPQGEVCDPDSGRCLERLSCRPADDACDDEAGCATCPEGQVCDAGTGFCVSSGVCQYLDCPLGQVCDPLSNQCEQISCGGGDACPVGSVCADGATCAPGCAANADCRQGELCVRAEGAAIGSCNTLCTMDAECPWGERCLQSAGRSQCAPEPPCDAADQCREGESCRQGACQRALCARDADCLIDEFCYVDTGACTPDNCRPDTLEPNNGPAQAVQLRQGIYGGLTLCGGEEDWFRFQTRGSRALAVSLLHSLDADLDLEAWFDGQPVAISAQGGFTERLTVSTRYVGEVSLRVRAQRGAQANYQLQLGLEDEGCAEDSYEPNNTLAEATPLALGRAQRLVSCPGDEDWVRLPARPGPLTVRLSPEGEVGEGAQAWWSSGDRAPWALSPGEEGRWEGSLAWVDGTQTPLLRLVAQARTPWQVEATAQGPSCDDAAAPSPTRAQALLWGLDAEAMSGAQAGALCAAGGDAGALEEDWYQLDLPPQALELEVALEDVTPAAQLPAPPLRVTLVAGPSGEPWRAAQGAPATLRAQLSRADAPLWLRVDAPGGLPAVLARWPAYSLRVSARPLTGACVQDRAERGDAALALSGDLDAILCPGDEDVVALALEARAGRGLRLVAVDRRVTARVLTALDAEPALIATALVGEEGLRLDQLEGWPAAAPQLWLSLVAEEAPAEGALYQLRWTPLEE
jgi:hypothetical protein